MVIYEFCKLDNSVRFRDAAPFNRGILSVWSDGLFWIQEVEGSNPSIPTIYSN